MRETPLTLTAVVPVLDEARTLPALLPVLVEQADQVVVSDGGSRDGTVQVARSLGAQVVEGPPGRGVQLNAGAAVATGQVLWFVHADTVLGEGVGQQVRQAAVNRPWGCFGVAIDSEDPRLRFTAAWMAWRARRSGSATGDMALWCRRALFDELGGFATWAAFEDLEFTDRARRVATPAVLDGPVRTSARRWQTRGVTRTVTRMWALRLGYRLGVDPAWLAGWYRPQGR